MFSGYRERLDLSNRLAKALGGQITIEDCDADIDHGCSFVITFMASIASSLPTKGKPDVSPSQGSVPALAGLQILLADDSRDNRIFVERVLARNGAAVVTANNGLEAYRKALDGSFDIVLMDIQMPEMDGTEATRALRGAGFHKPIIALTAHAMAEERAGTQAAGCSGHLTKPLNEAELLEMIHQLMP